MIKFWSLKYLTGCYYFLDIIIDATRKTYNFEEDNPSFTNFINKINDNSLYDSNTINYFNKLSKLLDNYQYLLRRKRKGKYEADKYYKKYFNKVLKSAKKVEINIFILTYMIFERYWTTFYYNESNKTNEDIPSKLFYQIFYGIFNSIFELNRGNEEEEEFLNYLCEIYKNDEKILSYIQKDIVKDTESLYYKEFLNQKLNNIWVSFTFKTIF